MDLSDFAGELRQDFVDPYMEIGDSRVWAPPVPTDLGMLAAEFFPDVVEDDQMAYEMIGEASGMRPLITMEWQEDNTEPFRSTIDLLPIGDMVYLCISPDNDVDQPWEAFAAIENHSDEILAPLFLDLFRDNGSRLGLDLMSTLPTWVETTLLAPITILMAWRAYLDWDEDRSSGAWQTAAEYLPADFDRFPRLVSAAREVSGGGPRTVREEFLASYVAATYAGLVRHR